MNQRELDAGAFRAADPVALHHDHFLGPVGQRLEAGEQLVGVLGDPKEPLLQVARLDDRAAAPAGSVDDLLVGQHGVVDRAPVDRRPLAVRQPALEHLQEDPLVELVVVRQAGRDLALPGVADAEPLQLPLHVRDVVERRRFRVRAGLDRGVLGRQAERVPPERVQHVEAAHPLGARHHVADDVVADVADVRVAGRVREHFEAVVLRARRIDVDLERPGRGPVRLPLLVELLGFVVGHEGDALILNYNPPLKGACTMKEHAPVQSFPGGALLCAASAHDARSVLARHMQRRAVDRSES